MDNIAEKFFANSCHVGNRFGRFRILVVFEDCPDFAASPEQNADTFRKRMHRESDILETFAVAAEELGISFEESDLAEFFAAYSYYWQNAHSLPRVTERSHADYLTRLVKELGAGLVLSCGGIGDERFRREHVELDAEDFLRGAIFVEVPRNRERLKKIFKAYLRRRRSGIDETVDRISEAIAAGKSPLDIFNELPGANNSSGSGDSFNTFPMGRPSRLHPELLVVCEDPMNLTESYQLMRHYRYREWQKEGAFNYIEWWCHETDGKFNQRRVVLLTDKWDTAAYKRYENFFRRFTKRGVTFEFKLFIPGAKPAEINLPF